MDASTSEFQLEWTQSLSLKRPGETHGRTPSPTVRVGLEAIADSKNGADNSNFQSTAPKTQTSFGQVLEKTYERWRS